MVKRILLSAAGLGLLVTLGCKGVGTPVYPAGSAPVLKLKMGDAVRALWAPDRMVVVKVRVAGKSHDPLTRSVTVNGGGETIDTISIELPSAGEKVVSSEWFEFGDTPRYLGADRIVVNGSTTATLKMGMLDGCYMASFSPGYDYLLFNNGFPNGDYANSNIQVANLTADGLELTGQNGAQITYLGNGDLLDHVEIPESSGFFTSSTLAKGASIVAGDVYGVRIPGETAYAWVQVSNAASVTNTGYADIRYRYNDQNDRLCVFDETDYGRENCNELFAPTPSPTFAP